MKKILITLAVVGLTGLSSAAFAQAAKDFAGADTDKSGDVSLAEAQVIWPSLTEDQYKAADTDANGSLNQAEYDAYSAANPPA